MYARFLVTKIARLFQHIVDCWMVVYNAGHTWPEFNERLDAAGLIEDRSLTERRLCPIPSSPPNYIFPAHDRTLSRAHV
jgi:hypothetical protein